MNTRELTNILKRPKVIEALLYDVYACGSGRTVNRIWRKAHLGSIIIGLKQIPGNENDFARTADSYIVIGGVTAINKWKNGLRDRACKVMAAEIISTANYKILYSLGVLPKENMILCE